LEQLSDHPTQSGVKNDRTHAAANNTQNSAKTTISARTKYRLHRTMNDLPENRHDCNQSGTQDKPAAFPHADSGTPLYDIVARSP
jgi:hypothetical protein